MSEFSPIKAKATTDLAPMTAVVRMSDGAVVEWVVVCVPLKTGGVWMAENLDASAATPGSAAPMLIPSADVEVWMSTLDVAHMPTATRMSDEAIGGWFVVCVPLQPGGA